MQVNGTASSNGYGETYSSELQKNDAMGKDAFLQLLVNQLRNQDPLNPVDDKEFLAQMAQFSTLEQVQNLNESFNAGLNNLLETVDGGLYDNYKALVGINSNLIMQQNFQAMNLLGKDITAVVETDGQEETIQGTVQSVSFKEGRVQIEVDGSQIYMDEITQFDIEQ
jgi:flagellar basal-body rod modification protein FlgD